MLQLRGVAAVTLVESPTPELVAAAIRYMGPEAGPAWVEQATRISPRQARIAVRPTWVDVLDFETRLPAGMARRLAGSHANR